MKIYGHGIHPKLPRWKLIKMSLINTLEKMRLNYTAKLEVINLKIMKLESNIFNEISNEFSDAKPVKLNKRGRPKKIYPVSTEIINEVSVDEASIDIQI